MSDASGRAPDDRERPTLRSIARTLGTTATTVSRALRNDPKISASMRARVRQAAADAGYRPDPEMAKFMHRLRLGRKPRFRGALAAVTTRPPGDPETYTQAILEGARRTADALGYTFELFHVSEPLAARPGLQRVLLGRGIEGVLLLPMVRPVDLGPLLDWSRFCAVAATRSVLQPALHRITPDHYVNTKRLCERLAERGYRRIGLAIRSHQDVRVNHAFTAAVNWHNLLVGSSTVPPLFFDRSEDLDAKRIAAWTARARPDVVVATDVHKCRLVADALGPDRLRRIGIASTNTFSGSPWSGIDELPGQIGANAIDVLAAKILRGSRGMPPQPVATMIEGVWHDGGSTRPPKPV